MLHRPIESAIESGLFKLLHRATQSLTIWFYQATYFLCVPTLMECLGVADTLRELSDLARLAKLSPAPALCELMKPDGSMARGDGIEIFAATHGLPILTIEETDSMSAAPWSLMALVLVSSRMIRFRHRRMLAELT